MTSEVLLVSITLLTGWAALLPMKRLTHPVLFHVSAFPVGLLAWAVATAVSILTGLPFWFGATLALPVYVVGCCFLLRSVGCSHVAVQRRDVPGFLITGTVALGSTIAATTLGYSGVTNDSWNRFAIYATRIWADGSVIPVLMGEANVLLPSVMAAQRLFGGDWPLALFPLLAILSLVAVVLMISFRPWGPPDRRRSNVLFGVAAALVMASTGSFQFYGIYVHANLMSTMYLTLAVLMVMFARENDGTSDDARAGRAALLVVAGLMLAGLALARQDGIAYTVIPIALFANGWVSMKDRSDDLDALFLPLLALYGVVMGAAIATLGYWDSNKFTGEMAIIAWIAVLVLFQILGWTERSVIARRVIHAASRFRVLIAIGMVAWTLQYVAEPHRVTAFTYGTIGNLLDTGGWGSMWYALAGTWLMGLVFFQRVKYPPRALALTFVVVFSFLVAFSVPHSASQPNWADSMNRFIFHFVPLSFGLSGLIAAAFCDSLKLKKPQSSDALQ